MRWAWLAASWTAWLLFAAGCGSEAAPPATNETTTDAATPGVETQRVTLAGEAFDLELALTHEARVQGLSDRASIPERGGMLFVFPRSLERVFVMRRCLVPIDLIYLDGSGRVVRTHAMAVEPYDTPESQLKRYGSRYPAQFAIELKGGWLERLSLEPGQKVDLPVEALKRRAG